MPNTAVVSLGFVTAFAFKTDGKPCPVFFMEMGWLSGRGSQGCFRAAGS